MARSTSIVAVVLLSAGVAHAGPPTSKPVTDQAKRELQRKVARLRMRAEQLRAHSIEDWGRQMAEYKARVQQAKRGAIDPDKTGYAGFVYTDRRDKRRAIREEQARLAEVEAELARLRGPCTIIPRLPNPPKVGDLGELPRMRVLQIIDADEMRVEHYGRDLWLRGVDTKDHADGTRLKPIGVFEVTTTKTYTTALGAMRTVLVAEPASIPAELLRLEPIETKGKKRRRPR